MAAPGEGGTFLTDFAMAAAEAPRKVCFSLRQEKQRYQRRHPLID